MTSAYVTFDYPLFCDQIPLYSDPLKYPEAEIHLYWDTAVNYVSDVNCGSVQNEKRAYAINLMTGHLLYIAGLAGKGQVPGLMQNATIDKLTVGLTPPPLRNQWQWWLSISPYGQQLLALLQVNSVGGFYVGGSPTLAGFPFWTYGRGGTC